MRPLNWLGWTVAVAVALAWPASSRATDAFALRGQVESGGIGVRGARVILYRAGTASGGHATVLRSALADGTGRFVITGVQAGPADILYLVSEGGEWAGRPGSSPETASASVASYVTLASVLGRASPLSLDYVVNERTTVAFAYALAQFTAGHDVSGPSPGLGNAAATAGNLVDVGNGAIAPVLDTPPNGSATEGRAELNSLANLLASCVEAASTVPCRALSALAPSAYGGAGDTLSAVQAIATNPTRNVSGLFRLSLTSQVYKPALTSGQALSAWTLAITYVGNGHEFDGPGNTAVDKDGNLWITNNYVYSSDQTKSTCGSKILSKLTPTGSDAPGAPFAGGGVDGAGFGVVVDPRGVTWVGNFGFSGQGCAHPPAGDSVSAFTPSGVALSPDVKGFTQGDVAGPQGMALDKAGNLWIANNGVGEHGRYGVTKYIGGDPGRAVRYDSDLLDHPFDVVIDAVGRAWVTSTGSKTQEGALVVFSNDGKVVASYGLAGTPSSGTIIHPLGAAIDSTGNVWVANSGAHSIARIEPSGKVTDIAGGGLDHPWGIAIDGHDNVFAANFGGATLSEFCGVGLTTCGSGHKVGDPISPPGGFVSASLVRLTAVTVDTAGNVWVPDNWMKKPQPPNPGGHAMVEFIGLAAPVKAPLIGPPQVP